LNTETEISNQKNYQDHTRKITPGYDFHPDYQKIPGGPGQ
jgi:hypothetical protein